MHVNSASVKVMRSHDYCHFEVVLGLSGSDAAGNPVGVSTEQVDELRKEAARLADKAVKQYKIAKIDAIRRNELPLASAIEVSRIEMIRAITESCRTPEQMADLKAYDDETFRRERVYNYEDQWEHNDEDGF